MVHDPRASLLDMLQTIERAQRIVDNLTEKSFLEDIKAQWAIFSQIIILGEAAGRLDLGYQSAHPHIPWSQIIGMRHRLVHGYDSVDWGRVWQTVRDDLPPLLEQLQALISTHSEDR